MNHHDAQLRRLRAPNFLVPETRRSENRFRENRTRPDKYPLTPIDCSTSLLKYSRWSLARPLSLQPAAVAGKKKNKRFLSPARKASPVSRENAGTMSRSFRGERVSISRRPIGRLATKMREFGSRGANLDARDFRPCRSETETVRPSELLRRSRTLSFNLCPSVSLLFSPSPALFS